MNSNCIVPPPPTQRGALYGLQNMDGIAKIDLLVSKKRLFVSCCDEMLFSKKKFLTRDLLCPEPFFSTPCIYPPLFFFLAHSYRMETAFDELTILKYFHVFKEYCKCLSKEPEKLELTGEEFILIPCLAVNPLRDQFLRCIPSKSGAGNHMGNVDFPAFMRLLAVTNGDARVAEKLKFAFQMYDMDGDGKIHIDDLVGYLSLVTDFDEDTTQQVEEYQEFIKKAAKKTFEELGRDNFLRLEDFAKTLLHSDFAHKYVLAMPLNKPLKTIQKKIDKVQVDLEAEHQR